MHTEKAAQRCHRKRPQGVLSVTLAFLSQKNQRPFITHLQDSVPRPGKLDRSCNHSLAAQPGEYCYSEKRHVVLHPRFLP